MNFRKEIFEIACKKAGGVAELEKEFFRMTKGGEFFTLVKDGKFLEELRDCMMKRFDLDKDDMEVAPGQPFHLRLLRRMLEEAGDCDFDFLRQAEEGLPLGLLNELPRTSAVFEKQVKWALDYDPSAVWELSKSNYISAVQHSDHLKEHLEAEVKAGLMSKMSKKEFEVEYGENRAIAALAVLVEDEASGKKRVIHDGAHEIGVNNRIRCKDKVRMPGPREKRKLLQEFGEERCVVMSLVGDFEKAHRRFLYRAEERGFLACVAEENSEEVYINHVGTFGIGSTPYWWARISAALIRFAHAVLGPGYALEMLLYADDLEVMAVGHSGRIGAVLNFALMASVGAPFKWGKQRGGWVTEWVGITTDYRSLKMGLSEKRAKWLCGWIDSLAERMEVTDAEFAAGLGRLSFASLALPWERPLLGPLFGRLQSGDPKES